MQREIAPKLSLHNLIITMAKGNMLLGQARGKVGDLVFARQSGQQVVRARAAVVRNPQTEVQMIQRILMNTVAQAYSKMSAIVDHSFEGIEKGQKSMSFFMSKNLKTIRERIAQEINEQDMPYSSIFSFTKIGQNYFAPNEYLVAKGQLPEVRTTEVGDSEGYTSIAIPANATYQQVLSAAGLQRGDQLTFLFITGRRTNMAFNYARVILDPHNADGTPAELSVAFLGAEGAVNLPSPKNEGIIKLAVKQNEDSVNVLTYKRDNAELAACAVIVSRKRTDGTWLRSNASLFTEDTLPDIMFSLQSCLDSLASGGINEGTNPLYLNNAGSTGNAANQGGGGSGDDDLPTNGGGGNTQGSGGDGDDLPGGGS